MIAVWLWCCHGAVGEQGNVLPVTASITIGYCTWQMCTTTRTTAHVPVVIRYLEQGGGSQDVALADVAPCTHASRLRGTSHVGKTHSLAWVKSGPRGLCHISFRGLVSLNYYISMAKPQNIHNQTIQTIRLQPFEVGNLKTPVDLPKVIFILTIRSLAFWSSIPIHKNNVACHCQVYSSLRVLITFDLSCI